MYPAPPVTNIFFDIDPNQNFKNKAKYMVSIWVWRRESDVMVFEKRMRLGKRVQSPIFIMVICENEEGIWSPLECHWVAEYMKKE